ncbi:MAG: LD-carboxypeptidase [Melioribacteraceae bacterium]|nr:LD-carboxypeptidase [Melioribacteraceae bacterium]
MKKITAKHLKKGDTIGIVSVSAPEPALEPEWFERGIHAIQRYGYKTKLSKYVQNQVGYLSNKVELLAADVNELFASDDVDAIICAGGGINANGLLRHLDYDIITANPKILLGVSNPSVILNAIYARCGLITFHGPAVVWNFGNPDGLTNYTETHLIEMLTKQNETVNFQAKSKWKWFREGNATGRLLGGNLISIQALLGTNYIPDWKNSIFFWEDIGKSMDRIEMMLTHFKDTGVFEMISGMVVGELVNCKSNSPEIDLFNVLEDIIGEYSFPVLCNVDLGHTDDKITLPIGCQAELNSSRNEFKTVESAVN